MLLSVAGLKRCNLKPFTVGYVYRGSWGGPSCPVLINWMACPLRWLCSIRTDTGFFPPGKDRDRAWGGVSVPPFRNETKRN